ncbi:MAG: RNA polymerase I-specific transcription initiation factor RRN3-domain-containing protein [Monoraphidium minutum]|nr:MAG: RNA polymerase I-specific transcription initiation factor RRN3-domain-containing protein [Monoraphidium minutum]
MAAVNGADQHAQLVVELRKSVHAALVAKAKGTSTAAYTNLVRDLAALKRRLEADDGDAEASFSLTQLLRALGGCVATLRERKHDALLGEVLGLRMWLATAEVRAALLEVVVNLMVANGAFTHNCLQAMLLGLLPPPAAMPPDDAPGSERVALQLIPTLPTQLLPMLLLNLPHKARPRPLQCLYLRAVLGLAEAPSGAPLREGLLLGIVDHLLSLDVEIKWEDIVDVKTGQEHEEGSSEEEDHEDIFELEGMQELDIHGVPIPPGAAAAAGRPAGPRGGWEGGAAGAGAGEGAGEGAEGGADARPAVDESVDKMDSMMGLVLEHLSRRFAAGQQTQLWHTLQAAFDRSLLHTHRSKFTQYLLFRAIAEDPATCAPAFASMLLARLRDARQPPVTRAAAAAYLSSFLARCALAPEGLVVDVLTQLAAACTEYAARAGDAPLSAPGGRPGVVALPAGGGGSAAVSTGGGDATRHAVFYAMVQALLYVLCYHMEPLVRQQRHHPGASPAHAAAVKALVRGAVAPLLGHARLAPLAVCLPSVSAEFVRQAAALKLADLTPLLAAAQQRAAGGGADGGGALGRPAVRPLEMFFPFDPYLLRRSSRHLNLEKTYVRWRGGHPEAGGAESDGEDGGGAAAAAAAAVADAADAAGDGVSSSGSEESEVSSSDLEDDADHHMAASEDGAGGLTPPGLAGGGAPGGGGAKMHRAASIGGLRPVGVAAAAANARRQAQQQLRLTAAGMSLSGPSPDAMMLGTSILSSEGALGASYPAPGGGAAGTSLDDGPPLAFRGGLGLGGGASPGGDGTPLGASPAPMSYTPYDGTYMASIPARLDTQA